MKDSKFRGHICIGTEQNGFGSNNAGNSVTERHQEFATAMRDAMEEKECADGREKYIPLLSCTVTYGNNISENVADTCHLQKLHVNSLLLAGHSDYFMRLFSNGMSESHLQVGFHDLIQYMYNGHLKDPLDVESTVILLRLADRFAITSCMKPLAEALKRLPSTVGGSLLVLGLPESLKTAKTVQPMVEHCSNYLTQYFADISLKKAEFLSLTLEGVKVVLGSDTLNVSYEEEVFYYLLDWLNANCETEEEKKNAAEEIAVVVRFPWMTGDFLVDVVGTNSGMASVACQALLMDAMKFKSFTHARQQLMVSEKTHHNWYRPRNSLIMENFWGNSKTFTVHLSDMSCQVFFEFPLELVICTGQNFQSRPFSIGGKYTFYLEAQHGQVKTSYNHQLTCYISLVLPSISMPNLMDTKSQYTFLEYAIAMKRDYSQSYDTKAAGILDLRSAEIGTKCIGFTDLFSGWFIERGFSFPRWNLTINGPVFLRLDLTLKDRRS
eukprot:Gb_16774 [translate_table: standard]